MDRAARPAGGGGGSGEGLGRSRGGFTSKIHLSADGWCRPLSLLITAGQRADCTQFQAVLDKIRVPRPVGRPRNKPDSVAADKAYSNGPIRRYLRRRGIAHTIPEKSDSRGARLRQRSWGGGAPGFAKQNWAQSNTPCLLRWGVSNTILENSEVFPSLLRKGSGGGLPPGFDKQRYAKRNTIERAINKLKQFRAVATRYDKRGYVFLGTVTTAALVIWLRT